MLGAILAGDAPSKLVTWWLPEAEVEDASCFALVLHAKSEVTIEADELKQSALGNCIEHAGSGN